MARPIKETPILEGKDAEKFARTIKENENKKISPEEYERMLDNYNRISELAKFE